MGAVKNLNDNVRTYGYFSWLCEIIEADYTEESYYILLKKLHSIPFTFKIYNDVNRVLDAKKLRHEYFGDSPDVEGGNVSVLEVLIGISERCSDASMEETDEDLTGRWFWELISNLDLAKYTDELYYEVHGNYEVNRIVGIFLDRKYDRNGSGGIFPLRESIKNQRKIEIWYQMNAYLQEKYQY